MGPMVQPPLNPAIRAWLDRAQTLVPHSTNERDAARELSDRLFAEFGAFDPAAAERIEHTITVSGRTLDIHEYRPRDVPPDQALPAYLSLHGGAFRLGTIDELVNVALCAHRARDAGIAVFTLDYRLAPEHPFPAALDDAVDTLSWLVSNAEALRIDSRAIVIGGVSAGGSLSAALSAIARNRRLPVCGQLLEVPVLDLRDDGVWDGRYAEINGFTTVADLRGSYARAADGNGALLSPLLGDLRGTPPTHVMIAEYDPLRRAAELFVERLRAAGNTVTATMHRGELHASHGLLRDSRAARLWHAEAVAVLREFTARVDRGASSTE